MDDQNWKELIERKTKANIKADAALRAWETAVNINSLGMSEEGVLAYRAAVKALQEEYQRCQAEALEISDMFNAAYKGKVDELKQGTISFSGPGANRWKEIYKKSPPPDGVTLID